MRRAFFLLALGITLVMTAGQDLFTLKNVKVIDKSKTARDQWSMKGNLDDPTMTVVPLIGQEGLTVELQDMALATLESTAFAASDCKLRRNGRGVSCKTRGARVSIKMSRRPKGANVQNSNYNSTGGYYSASGMFRRLQFLQDPIVFPLTVVLNVPSIPFPPSAMVSSCSEKIKGAGRTTRITCTPGPTPVTPAPTTA
ncbi:hypothetical protein NGA_0415500 [Nannochloropsis gaditana CCMP526]|uniref:uncharacterized protein n=1 Tax=Nannochloropsis gaditana (strain CCMP526) TaxID=1093141 RepID=UPI00029F7C82|nr:hypothetical protein NGA_0415500 [Nannochloropsis gaditana CCMP526]EKU21331.1 hypothetical protein NGA_0415500 [Nannochloropsis gaditana CCMP526]|eukprot:XP_005855033.1 hypothetical protein NGA_0415500 [Nannochloropsis gaditana CCMP526]